MNSAVLQMTVENAKNGNTRSAWLLEEEISRRGLQDVYIDALMQTVVYPAIGENHWLLLHATPEQRAQAFVAVCALEREV
jgi:hypothetical protein